MAITFDTSKKLLFTSESVTEGHPDKVCDQISDAILDAMLTQDPMARVACETSTTTGLVLVHVVYGLAFTTLFFRNFYVSIPDALVKAAGELGLDQDQFEKDMGSKKVADAVQEQQDEAMELGITSTPAFAVNKRPIIGAQPAEVFLKTIDAELDELQK